MINDALKYFICPVNRMNCVHMQQLSEEEKYVEKKKLANLSITAFVLISPMANRKPLQIIRATNEFGICKLH